MDLQFVDVGTPLSPADAGALEYELERRGIAVRLRLCARDAEGDHQVVQVASEDLPAAMAARAELVGAPAAPDPPRASRSRRWRNGLIAAVLGLVGSARVVRLVRVPRGPVTALIVVAVALALFVAVSGFQRD